MAVETWQVVFGKRVSGAQLDGTPGKLALTKAQGEELSGKLTEKVEIVGPIYECKMVKVEAETASMAVVGARYLLGFDDGTVGKPLAAKTANLVETAAR
jgi:hypothetical protein